LGIANWTVRSIDKREWDEHWSQCLNPNLHQSWEYGSAKVDAEGWGVERLLILDSEKSPVSLAQLLTRGVDGLGYIARMNRGPILVKTPKTCEEDLFNYRINSIYALIREASFRNWHILNFAPEFPFSESYAFAMRLLRFRKINKPPWESAKISLNISDDELMMSLDGKWRNSMRKGKKMGVTIVPEYIGNNVEHLLRCGYRNFKRFRGFKGIPDKLIGALLRQPNDENWRLKFFLAKEGGSSSNSEPLGLVVTAETASTATYLIGFTTERGRALQANSVLLWEAIINAKNWGCRYFDVGGLGEETPIGIAEFKRGLNGEPYKNIGDWWRVC
jgi:lipid II:glycine glycyltransferase (peptidoglycan interpeptide bridge formation enzyme)